MQNISPMDQSASANYDHARQHKRDLVLDVSAADDTARRVPAVISTEYAVARDDYDEILVHADAAIDLGRAPLPLIEQHQHGRLNIGIVENLRIEDSMLRADVVFGTSARATELWPDVKSGIVRNLSIGYVVLEHRIEGRTVYATRWQPFEVSLVSVPADPGAGFFRSIDMSNAPAAANAAPVEIAVRSERARVAEIRALAARHLRGVEGGQAIETEAIEGGASSDDFRKKVLEHLASIDQSAGGMLNRLTQNGGLAATGGSASGSESRDFIAAAGDALLLRSGFRIATPHAAARDFRGMSVLDMAAACIQRVGRSVSGETPQGILRRAMSTGDFPALLGDTLNKALRNGMENEQASHRIWCSITEAADFRVQSRVILGSAPDLLGVGELGEYKNGPLQEDKSTLVPAKFGRIVSLSWESLLADNLGGFVNIGRSLGQAAMRAEADSLYGALTSNALAGPTLSDGTELFHSTRNNIVLSTEVPSTSLDVYALAIARAKLRRQTNVGGGLLNLTPRFLLVPPELETAAEILVAKSTVHRGQASADAATPAWVSGLVVVAEPRLTDVNTFYLAADANQIGTGEVSIVDDSPHIEEIEEPRTDCFSWKVRHAFAAGFVDFRGLVRVTLPAAS